MIAVASLADHLQRVLGGRTPAAVLSDRARANLARARVAHRAALEAAGDARRAQENARAALDNYANSVTPPAQEGQDRRAARHRLRDVAARLLPQERVANCGRKTVGGRASIVLNGATAYVGGVETCGSVWLCPVCAAKIAEGRREDVETVLDRHAAAGGAVYMLTLTVPHTGWEFLVHLRQQVADAWRRMARGAPWQRMAARVGLVGSVRALEVTHGRHGWHPHLHVLLLTDAPVADEAAWADWLYERWAACAGRAGITGLSRRAFRLERAAKTREAGDYIAKWGADSEIAKAHCKVARGGNRSPWGLLAAAEDGDRVAAMLWREYAGAFKGTRHLTWSRGLRERYGVGPEPTDEQLAAWSGGTALGHFERGAWHRIQRAKVVPDLLAAAERGGWREVLAVLGERGLSAGLPPCRASGMREWPPGDDPAQWLKQGGV